MPLPFQYPNTNGNKDKLSKGAKQLTNKETDTQTNKLICGQTDTKIIRNVVQIKKTVTSVTDSVSGRHIGFKKYIANKTQLHCIKMSRGNFLIR